MNDNTISVRKAIKCMVPRVLKKLRCDVKAKKMYPEVWELIKRNSVYEGLHEGRRCFILGNGPSLRSQDLSHLAGEVVFSCNKICKDRQFSSFKPTYHLWTDARLFNADFDEEQLNRTLETIVGIKKYGADPIVFFSAAMYQFIKAYDIDQAVRAEYLIESSFYCPSAQDKVDFTKPIPHVATVVQAAIYLAIYMGFAEIYLLGCDCTGFVSLANEFSSASASGEEYCYEVDKIDMAITRKALAETSVEAELENYVDLFQNYEIIDHLAKKHGIKIVNATKGGVLEKFQRCDFESLF